MADQSILDTFGLPTFCAESALSLKYTGETERRDLLLTAAEAVCRA